MKKVRIYCFSGTGNTEYVASLVAEGLARRGCEVELARIEDELRSGAAIRVEGLDLVGIACPVIGYGVPLVVRRFLRALPRAEGLRAFILRTAGGVVSANYNASRPIWRALGRRGYEVFHERLFAIGSNWIVRFGNAAMRSLHDAARRKAELMCDELLAGKERRLGTSLGRRLVMGIVRGLSSLPLRFVALDLRVAEDCARCGLCVRSCPGANISDEDGKIRFGAGCSCCLRCVYSCPRGAIRFKTLGFFAVKGGYDLGKIIERPEEAPDEGARMEPPFMAEYLRDPNL